MKFNFLFLFISIFLTIKAQTDSLNLYKQVGDISFDPLVDASDFAICSQSTTFQYYSIFDYNGAQYEGDIYEIIQRFKEKYVPIEVDQTGYITIRFLVNCEGKTGLFRTQEMGENYLPIDFDKQITEQLLLITKSLDKWIIGEYKGRKVDYYQYLTYKIEKGKLKEILP